MNGNSRQRNILWFGKMWLRESFSKDVVLNDWTRPYRNLVEKLAQCGQSLKIWDLYIMGNVKKIDFYCQVWTTKIIEGE